MGRAKKKSKKQAAKPLRALKGRRSGVPDAEAHVKEGKARGRAARKLVPRSSLAAYLGKSDTFDRAIADFAVADFAVAYADLNQLDYEAMLDAAADARIMVQPSDR